MPNRLAQETSPYLLQHAENPVDWYPWGPEAFERAAREDKPILLSIGYAACHWCHVMERESFEDAAIAERMNRDFVCIKVDREERPDLDQIYMAATVALSGSGGWPMTVFLTPDKRPFFAGTYFPPTDRYGRPGFPALLERLADLWKNDRATLERQAEELTRAVQRESQTFATGPVSGEALGAAARALVAAFDPRWGGFGSAPKFPPSASLELLLRYHRKTGDERALEVVKKTLDGMKNGGIFDHLGGGFARYSVDERWHVPHFEKMLYDNAQLAAVYLAAHQVTGDLEYADVARRTLDFVAREMQDPEGGYYSAFDADSEGEEGKFYVWKRDELDTVLDREAAEHFALFYDVTHEGNWEGTNVLWRRRTVEQAARELGVSPEKLAASLEDSRQKLYAARKERVAPALDDKVLTAWNGLMIAAMAEGARVLGEPRYLESAERAARFALGALRRPDGGLYRTAREGRAHVDGYLEDYAFLADGLVTLYEAGGGYEFLSAARELAGRLIEDFGDQPGAAFFHTAKGHESLITRPREGHDGAIPNPNSVAARALARLAVHFDEPTLAERGAEALRFYGELVERAPRGFATLLNATEFWLEGPVELVYAGGRTGRAPLERSVASHYLPDRVIAFVDPDRPEPERALTAGKAEVNGAAALYVCRDFACRAPVTDPAGVAAALEENRTGAERKASLEPPRLAARASEVGTRRLSARFGRYPAAYAPLGKTGLMVSRLGFGTYRVAGRPAERAALAHALENGINIIDTSTNYTDGASERTIGSVLAELVQKKKLLRDEVVLVSKVGYVQGKNLEIARGRKEAGKPYPEMVELDDELWHCIHPEWIADQLTLSLSRLGVETLDVFLLHNPEYFLKEGIQAGRGNVQELRTAFYQRVEAAFVALEREVASGRIGCYGVSSNTVAFDGDHREATNLARFLEAAKKAGGENHHFRVLELPFNLLEAGAHLETRTGYEKSVLELAADEQIAVLANRPLNAFRNDTLERLVDAPIVKHALMVEFARNQVAALEREFRDTLAPSLKVTGETSDAGDLFAWADRLADIAERVQSYEQWRELEERMLRPQIGRVLAAFDQAKLGALEPLWQSFRNRYIPALDQLLTSIRAEAAEISRARDTRLHAALDSALPETLRALTLTQKALLVESSTRGVTSALVGARKQAYVDDLIRVLSLPPLEPEVASRALREIVQQGV
jgi:uncharacterized protein YyaL (SSP411 family)/aryl-alcohol dehydrogenase-like predicted oxidoreductase